MSTTVDLACTGSALVTKESPSSNQHGLSSYQLQGGNTALYYTYLLLKFEELPQEYRYYNLLSARYYITLNRNMVLGHNSSITFDPLQDTFDPSTVTYDSKPSYYSGYYKTTSVSNGSGDIEVYQYLEKDGQSSSSEPVMDAISHYAASVRATSSLRGSYYCDAYSELAASAKRPYLRITMTDSPASCEVFRVSPESYARFDVTKPITFSWRINFVGEGSIGFIRPLAAIVQTSADIVWKEKTDADWTHRITVQGDVRSFTVPANTFPARDIYWKVEPTLVVYPCYNGDTVSYGSARPRMYVDTEASTVTDVAGVSTFNPDSTIPWSSPFGLYYGKTYGLPAHYKNLLAQFESFPAEYNYFAIDTAGMCFRTIIPEGKKRSMSFYYLQQGFDARTVTWNTMPIASGAKGAGAYDNQGGTRAVSLDGFFAQSTPEDTSEQNIYKSQSKAGCETLKNAAFMLQANIELPDTQEDGASGYFSVIDYLYRRAMVVDLTVTSKPEATTNASGYVNPHVAQTFAWTHVPDGDYYCVGGWETVSATLYWSSDNGSTWNSVAAEAGSSEVVLPAETLPTGTIKWYVTATDDEGTTASSEVYEITTTDSATTATPIVPKETVENGDQPIRFIWETANDHDTEPTGADLQKSNNGTTWTTLAQISTGATQYDAPAGTFTTGTRYWRVRAYNADGVAGAWSDPVTFVVVAAPPAPVVSADGKPYATITWQSSGQMAYRVTVDGKLYGPYFGTAKSFETPDFLTDGSHTAEVSVQGEAGLWSQPGSVTFSVTNVPGDPVGLTGKYGRDAALRWSTEATVANFYIYRDGIRIGHTAAKQFTDRFVLGAHEYFAVNKLPGGYYTRSNLSSGTMRSCTRAVAAFDGGGWLEMALSDESDTTEEFAWNQVVSERYVTGSDLPVVETSPYRSGSGSYRISFASVETGAAFEALRGRKVIVKSRGGNVAIGVLSGYTKTMGNFYINYVFSVRSCSWEDYVDETGD